VPRIKFRGRGITQKKARNILHLFFGSLINIVIVINCCFCRIYISCFKKIIKKLTVVNPSHRRLLESGPW